MADPRTEFRQDQLKSWTERKDRNVNSLDKTGKEFQVEPWFQKIPMVRHVGKPLANGWDSLADMYREGMLDLGEYSDPRTHGLSSKIDSERADNQKLAEKTAKSRFTQREFNKSHPSQSYPLDPIPSAWLLMRSGRMSGYDPAE